MSRLDFTIIVVLSFATRALCDDDGPQPGGEDADNSEMITMVHGIMASIAWVFLFPVGAILIRLLKTRNAWWIHASIQSLTILVVTASAATGIILADRKEEISEYHPVIGLVLFAAIFLQAAGGIIHHLMFKKHHRPSVITKLHIWSGRILITVGMINGGLGLLLADEERKYNIAYGVVAAFIWLVYVVVAATHRSPKPADKSMMEKS